MHARLARAEDAAQIAAIYNEGIADRVATFETRERAPEEMAERLSDPAHPFVVVEGEDGRVLAFAGTSATSARECYAQNAEFMVYVARAARGRGCGKRAMLELMARARDAGLTKLESRVFPENEASLALLRSLGFREVGVHEKHARLDGVWRDVVIVERLVDR